MAEGYEPRPYPNNVDFAIETMSRGTNENGNAWVKNTNDIIVSAYTPEYILLPFKNVDAWFVKVLSSGMTPAPNLSGLSISVLWRKP